MRVSPMFVLLCGVLCVPARAASYRAQISEEENLASQEQRAAQAPSKAQCYLYAQLVHEMVEYSARQFEAGNVEKAAEILKRSQGFTSKIRTLLSSDTKKLKEAQILLRRTVFRLNDVLHAGSYTDEAVVEQTLAEVNQAQSELMLKVFQK